MSAKDDKDAKAVSFEHLVEVEKKLNFKIMDARDAAIAYLREYVQEMEIRSQLPESFEKIKVIENQFSQIVSKISHWRKRLEYLVDLGKHGWLHQEEEDELDDLKNFGADWEYYTVISTRIGPMRRRLAYLRKKRADKKDLKGYEQAELSFLRSLGVDSVELAKANFEDGSVTAKRGGKPDRCPAEGRIGYDLDSFEACSDCNVRLICSQKADEIEGAFKR